MATQVGLFSVEGTATQVKWIQNAVARCTYPLERIEPRMNSAGYTSVRVVFLPGSDPIFQNQFWAFAQTYSKCTISIRSDMPASSPSLATKVLFLHEVGHFVDAFAMNDTKRRRIHRYYHNLDPYGSVNPNHGWFDPDPAAVAAGFTSYRSEQQEGFASDFIDLYSDLESGGYQSTYSHTLIASRYDGARTLVLGSQVEEPPSIPDPEPEPQPEPPPDTGVDPFPYDPCAEAA